MTRLLGANFACMKKSRNFHSCMAFMASCGLFMAGMSYYMLYKSGHGIPLENMCFGYANLMGFAAAVFISLFLGTEYSDGTIRNKLTVGHKRYAVYLAGLIINLAGVLLINAVYVGALLLVGIPLFGGFHPAEPSVLLTMALLTVFMDASYTAVFTMCSMLNRNRASMTAVSIMSVLILTIVSGYIRSRLNEPKMFEPYTYMTEEGYEFHKEAEVNPYYLEGTEREVYVFLNDFLPCSQGIQIENQDRGHEWQRSLYSCLIVMVSTGTGILLFNRKDIH